MIAGRGGTTAVSDLSTGPGLAGTAGPRRAIEERGNSCAAPRGCRVTPLGAQTATVVGGSGGVCRTDPVVVPSLPTTSDRHPGHHLAVAPGLGEATLDSAPKSPKRRPAHGTRAAPVGLAAGHRELLLGLSTHPRRTRRAWLPDRGQYRIGDPEAGRHRSRAAPRWAQLAAIPAGTRPGNSRY